MKNKFLNFIHVFIGIWILILFLLSGCSNEVYKSKQTNIFKIKVVYVNNEKDSKIVEFWRPLETIHFNLVNNCIEYEEGYQLLCDVKKYKIIPIKIYKNNKK